MRNSISRIFIYLFHKTTLVSFIPFISSTGRLAWNRLFSGAIKFSRFYAQMICTLALGGFSLYAVATETTKDMVGGPAVRQLNLTPPVTRIAEQIYDLHTFMLIVCAVIFVAVFGVMFYSIYAHRKSKGYKAATFHESTTVEIIWTIIPMLIVIGMAAKATGVLLSMRDTGHPDVTIKATGYQWRWSYDYVQGEGQGIRFYSTLATPRDQLDGKAERGENYLLEVDNEVVVPVNRKIRILVTAADVIHAWMIPAFGVKQDAVPGFIRDTWFQATKIGKYRGQCAELCGKDHGYMPIVVNVVSDEDYKKWVEEQNKKMLASQDDPSKVWTKAELVKRGEDVYNKTCLACHQANGRGTPPAFPPLDGSHVVTGDKEGQIAVLLVGRKNTAMVSFAKILSDTELAAVMTYTRNAWSNKAEEGMITPAEVKAGRAWEPARLAELAAEKPELMKMAK